MKLLLLCLGLTLLCVHGQEKRDVVTSNFDMAKISGEWYTVLLAADSMEKIEENGSFRMFMEYIQALDNSSLLLKYHKEINGECTELPFVADETEEEGVYDVPYDGYNWVQIAEAVYNEYLISYTLNIDHEKITKIIELDARNPDVSPQPKKRIEEHCQKYGIPTENVVDVSNAETHSVSLWAIRGCLLTVFCSASADPCSQAPGNHGSQSSSAE
ncbi:LOW QUALITY PROTEIN: major allergen Equ c 1-like [Artibeus jamaicensis]|uniref:LOW QUALITY PROTEIN: major allergen Equ c 1-like n=1 Tax=Artibeus jamaicensis TaxID=9417 RepID=UPI00235A55C1|nr:LOW QUALITY PROTEIN: major allergen Equ c 1-like [Artibeus jamaicensis]